MRIIFAGTPDFSVPALQALVDAGHAIAAVYTQPDRHAGRGRKVRYSAVKQAALGLGLHIEQPVSLRNESALAALRALVPDVMIVVAYGLILPAEVLAIPRYGCINIHASLLPRWRGAAPIQRAIEHGDEQSGITIMQMDTGLDTGSILARYPVAIGSRETSQSLHDRLASLGGRAIVEVLADIGHYQQHATPQNDAQSTYAAKLNRDESCINWSDAGIDIERKVRAFNPWPLAKTWLGGTQLNLYEAQAGTATAEAGPGTVTRADATGIVVQCGTGQLSITRLQRPGGKPLLAGDFLNGMPISPGVQLASTPP
jgi:methionyl-tRNA formyltransferase